MSDPIVLDQQPAYDTGVESQLIYIPVSNPEGEVPEKLLLELQKINESPKPGIS
jgi:hypothetical protein